ncbi:ATP-binding protein [Denitrobaculum tricleocarpae]|uniref:histidine kinase n=1 Tax=Denitrobaculum tricleocarpae TaxID=2591009 RepID=A0A545TX71_9PROT|nr:ATP-binding protein [Denitrobaculum tricleocarpae]TQV81825.1 response regulator [Denitrobaculum tricleocarpae]
MESGADNRKDSEDDIRRARDLLQDAIESLSEGFALYDDDRRLVMCNQRYKEMNAAVADMLEPGLDWEILMRETARRGVYSDAVGREDAWVQARLQTTHDYVDEYELTHTDGTCYLVSTHPTKLGGFVVTRTDVTERKKAEFIEREGDLLVRTVLDASAAIVIMARTGDGQILYRSPAALELFGNTRSAKEHYANIDERADFITQMLADGQVDNYRLNVVAKGVVFPASISARFAEFRGEEVIVTSVTDLTEEVKSQELVKQVLEASPVPIQMTKAETGELLFTSLETAKETGEVRSYRSFFTDPDARPRFLQALREKGWLNDYRTEFVDQKGKVFPGAVSARLITFNGEEVIVSSTRDLTDELALQEEVSRQRDMLFQNEKMSALGELLAGVAHELNNPLSIVVGHSLMLREETNDADILRRIDKISNAAERSAKIVKTFLAMARQQPTKMEPVNIYAVLATAIDVAGFGQQQDGVEILSQLPDDLPEILADADQITQVVINLIINAGQAISTSGIGDRVEVSSTVESSGNFLEIVIADNGPGIPENIRARIFEPFFTTKSVGDGTGIGLAFCHRIIHSHGGQIRLDPQGGQGSRFSIRLPLAKDQDDAAQKEVLQRDETAAKRVLVVDDEADVAEFVAEVLANEGFGVTIANSGHEAITCLKHRRYDVLLSDLNMPEIDGRGLYNALETDFPYLLRRCAFITGDTMGKASQALLKELDRPFLEKPVSPDELRKLVFGILGDVKEDR